jgi:hypothetical protein
MVVRTYAPVGHTPILQEGYTRDHLSAISAISPEAERYFAGPGRPLHAEDGAAFLEHLRREVPGRLVMIWARAPIRRRRVGKAFGAHGAAARLHAECLPA